jgi:hypothetical protein
LGEIQHITEYHSHIIKHGGAALCYGHACHWQRLVFLKEKKTGYICQHRQNPIRKPGLVCFPTESQTLNRLSFQQDNNLKPKAKSTLELYQTRLNAPEWPSYNVDLNRLENLWQDLKMAV